MYNSVFFNLGSGGLKNIFKVSVYSVYKIITDNNYYNYKDNEINLEDNKIAFIRCTKGSIKICTYNREYILTENDCIFIYHKDIKKYYSCSPILEFLWVNFIAENYKNCFELNEKYRVIYKTEESKRINKLLQYGKNDSANKEYINHLFKSWLYLLFVENDSEIAEIAAIHNKSEEICNYIDQNIYSKITVEGIADFFNISSRYLHKIFTEELDISPKQYILIKKLEEGFRLVENTSLSINEIAGVLCFNSQSHFSNAFYKYFNFYPSLLRK